MVAAMLPEIELTHSPKLEAVDLADPVADSVSTLAAQEPVTVSDSTEPSVSSDQSTHLHSQAQLPSIETPQFNQDPEPTSLSSVPQEPEAEEVFPMTRKKSKKDKKKRGSVLAESEPVEADTEEPGVPTPAEDTTTMTADRRTESDSTRRGKGDCWRRVLEHASEKVKEGEETKRGQVA